MRPAPWKRKGRKEGNQAWVHNEQDELRAMGGIQKGRRTGRRVVCVYIHGGMGGWRGSLRQRGGARERASTRGSRQREGETAILISLLYTLPSPSSFTLLSSLQSLQ